MNNKEYPEKEEVEGVNIDNSYGDDDDDDDDINNNDKEEKDDDDNVNDVNDVNDVNVEVVVDEEAPNVVAGTTTAAVIVTITKVAQKKREKAQLF